MIKFREVRIAKKVTRSDAGDVSPVAMFIMQHSKPMQKKHRTMFCIEAVLPPTATTFIKIAAVRADIGQTFTRD